MITVNLILLFTRRRQ